MRVSQRSPRTMLLAGAALAAVVLLAGCTETPSVSRTTAPDADPGLSVRSGLTRFDAADRAVAPVVEGPAVTGSGTVTSSHPGRVVVVNVWQSTCGPCRGEAAALEEAAKRTSADATFVGLDVRDQRTAAQAFLRTSASSYAHVDDPDGAQLLKFTGVLPVSAIPSTLVVDRRGRVAARIVGPVSASSLTELVTEVAASS